jgi:hypothetical protein
MRVNVEEKLAAILVADVAEYERMIAQGARRRCSSAITR